MSDETDIDAGDDVELQPKPMLDFAKLSTDANKRYAKAEANPDRRGDPDKAFMGHVKGVLAANQQALSDSLWTAAEEWQAKSDESGIGPTARKHLLASKVLNGDYNKES